MPRLPFIAEPVSLRLSEAGRQKLHRPIHDQQYLVRFQVLYHVGLCRILMRSTKYVRLPLLSFGDGCLNVVLQFFVVIGITEKKYKLP